MILPDRIVLISGIPLPAAYEPRSKTELKTRIPTVTNIIHDFSFRLTCFVIFGTFDGVKGQDRCRLLPTYKGRGLCKVYC